MGIFGKTSRKALKSIGFIKTINTPEADEKLLSTIRSNVQLDADATEVQRLLELDDLRFLDPTTQWSDEDRRSRETAGRPCLTEDRLGPFHRQVCNEQRKNKPAVQVNPVDSGADVDTAEVAQGLIRHIEYSSNADIAYDTAFWWAAGPGRGFYRLCTDFVDDESDNQEIQVKRIINPHMVFVDPTAQEGDFSDMKWGGFKSWFSREDFKATWPEAQLSGADSSTWRAVGDDAEDWMDKDGGAILVVEYFYKEFTKGKAKSGRETIKTKVCRVVCTAVEILERSELPGEYIPIIAVLGEEKLVNGQRTWAGLVRAGKDPQKRYNYLLTAETERIAFMPIATWIGARGFMGKDSRVWAAAHKMPIAALEFDIIGADGQGINAPRLITEEAPTQAVTQSKIGAEQGLKAVLGMYDPNMGKNESGQSGIAINRLQAQGETGNYHLQDNLGRALRYEGRIILSWLPTYYDTERIIRIIGEDGTQKQVRINGPVQKPEEALNKEHVGKTFDMTTGRYDVTISAGPSYQSRREEDRMTMGAALTGPMGQLIANRAGDLWAKTLDSPIAKELAKRLVPPDIAAQNQSGASGQIPPQIKQQMDAMSQQHEQLVQALHAAQDKIEDLEAGNAADMAKAQLDSQTKVAIAEMNNQTELLKVQAQITGAGVVPQLQAKIAELEQSHDELVQLTLAHHDAISGQRPGGDEQIQPPQVMPPAGPMAGNPDMPAQPVNAGQMAGQE